MSRSSEPFAVGTLKRRLPFGDNPDVGARGTKTQQRILRAALEVFDEVGYHDCGVDRVTAKAKCSRPSFYQYFSSKQDLFRHLSGELSRRLFELTGSVGPITADVDGWQSLHRFVAGYGDLYAVYAPVFDVFSAAMTEDGAVATGATRVFQRQVTDLNARIEGSRHRHREVIVALLLNGVSRVPRFGRVLAEAAGPDLDRTRLDASMADVMHRALFGVVAGVNEREHRRAAKLPARAAPGPGVWPEVDADLGPAGRRTRSRLLESGRQVFTTNGFYETRVDDIVALAETSHGTFYRYFENKEAMFRILAARSGRRVVASVDDLVALVSPDGAVIDRELRAWLRRYFSVYATEGPILRAWMEATWSDVDLRAASPAEVEGLRRRLASVLAPRGFGDVDADAVALMAMLDRSQPGFEGVLPDERVALDAFTRVMQTSFLAEA